MGELRKDYVLDRYVIIATERSKRPSEFVKTPDPVKEEVCYFCTGNEDLTPPEIERFPPGHKDWQIRVFPNKFPAVAPRGNPKIRTDNNYFTFSDAYGYHEVIAETPDHEESLADVSEERLSNLFKMFNKRILVNLNSPEIRYVSVFKNHGKEAGTSIVHSHSQLVSINHIPRIIREKEAACEKGCPYCEVINIEKDSHRRCFENQSFAAFTPYASRFPLEIWVFPKRHLINLNQFSEEEFVYLGDIMKRILLKLKELNAPFNFYLQYGIKNMHFHIEILPRLAKWAGFEHSTGTIINTMTPEAAAEFYRG